MKPKAPKKKDIKPNCKSGTVKESIRTKSLKDILTDNKLHDLDLKFLHLILKIRL